MKILGRFVIVQALLLYVLVNPACDYFSSVSFVDIEKHRAKLIDGIESYQSIKDFELFLKNRLLRWEITGESKLSPQDRRPPFSIYEITIRDYSHLDFVGDLKVTFFNNRLMETRFYPLDVEGYIKIFAQEEGFDLHATHGATVPPFTHVSLATDCEQRKYIGWFDNRLDTELNTWIKRYS